MPKQEILPPSVTRQDVAEVPTVTYRSRPESALTRWNANSNARAVEALTRLTSATTGLVVARTGLVDGYIGHRRALARLAELPEQLDHEAGLRRMERDEQLRQTQHILEVNEARRKTELMQAKIEQTHVKTTETLAKVALVDAEQQLRAQKEHGYFSRELEHKKQALASLDVQLGEAERRELIDQHVNPKPRDASEVDALLYEYRDRLNAAGLDASRIDEILKARKR